MRENYNGQSHQREILKPLSDLRFSLDLFADRSAIAAHQTLIQTSKPHPIPFFALDRMITPALTLRFFLATIYCEL